MADDSGDAGASIVNALPTAFGPTVTNRFSSPTDEASALLKLLSQVQFPGREAGFMQVLSQLVARANASPEALGALASPQLQQMAQAILQATRGVSQKFGPFGGAQIPQALGQARAQQPFLKTFVDPTVKAGQGLQGFVGGTSLISPQGQKSTSVTEKPLNPQELAQSLRGLFGSGRDLYNAFGSGGGGGGQTFGAPQVDYGSMTGGYNVPTYGPETMTAY